MAQPEASVIVRTKDSIGTIDRTIESIRAQTVPLEIVVVDSGSTDGTLERVRAVAHELVEIPSERYTSGYALNLGVEAASGEVLFALSSHCVAPSPEWAERALSHYEREDVAGTAGTQTYPDGRPLEGPYFGRPEDKRHPYWGFSNHGSSWRRSAWEQHRFDEELLVTEDKEWAWRVIDAGWTIAYDPELWVEMTHRWRVGARGLFQRERREHYNLGTFADLPPYRPRDVVRDWWRTPTDDGHSRLFHLANYRRIAGLAGRYAGLRDARR